MGGNLIALVLCEMNQLEKIWETNLALLYFGESFWQAKCIDEMKLTPTPPNSCGRDFAMHMFSSSFMNIEISTVLKFYEEALVSLVAEVKGDTVVIMNEEFKI